MQFWNKHNIGGTWLYDEDGNFRYEDISSKEACMDLCLGRSECVAIRFYYNPKDSRYQGSSTCTLYKALQATDIPRPYQYTDVAVRCDLSYEAKDRTGHIVIPADGHYSPSPGKK